MQADKRGVHSTVAGVPLHVEDGLAVATDASGRPVARLAFALAQLPLGRVTELACVLSTDTVGTTGVHGRVRVARYPPHPHAVKVHTRLRALWTDDRPFLPVGFYLEYNRWQSGPANFSRVLAHEVVNGFTVPLPYRSGSPDAVRDSNYRALLDAAATMGLRVHFST
jgi:hypothetical protein